MITHVELALLPEDLREKVLAKYRVALMDPARKLSMHEAAWLYGYRYQTLRWLVCHKKVRSTGKGLRRRVTHAAMRQYRRGLQPGHQTRAQRMQQKALA